VFKTSLSQDIEKCIRGDCKNKFSVTALPNGYKSYNFYSSEKKVGVGVVSNASGSHKIFNHYEPINLQNGLITGGKKDGIQVDIKFKNEKAEKILLTFYENNKIVYPEIQINSVAKNRKEIIKAKFYKNDYFHGPTDGSEYSAEIKKENDVVIMNKNGQNEYTFSTKKNNTPVFIFKMFANDNYLKIFNKITGSNYYKNNHTFTITKEKDIISKSLSDGNEIFIEKGYDFNTYVNSTSYFSYNTSQLLTRTKNNFNQFLDNNNLKYVENKNTNTWPNGNVKSTGNIADDFHPKIKSLIEEMSNMIKKNGPRETISYMKTSKNHLLIENATMKSGGIVRDGHWSFYYEDGILGTEIEYDRGLKIEKKIYYKGSVNIKEFITYKNGFEDSVITYFKNGNVKTSYSCGYLNKKLVVNGIYKSFHENGNLAYSTTENYGDRFGITEWFYENGKLKTRAEYKYEKNNSEGLRWNIIELRDPNGNVLDKGTLKDGNGTWKIYDKFGVLKEINTYENGVKVE